MKGTDPKEALRQAEYHPYKDHELLISFGNLFRVIDVRRTSQPVMEIKDFFTTTATWSPCGTMIAAGLNDRIAFWDAVESRVENPHRFP